MIFVIGSLAIKQNKVDEPRHGTSRVFNGPIYEGLPDIPICTICILEYVQSIAFHFISFFRE